MATKKKIGKASTRKPARKKTSTKPKALGATLKAFGKVYKKKGCAKTKAAAQKSAAASKRAGRSAMVKKNPAGGYCVFTSRKKK